MTGVVGEDMEEHLVSPDDSELDGIGDWPESNGNSKGRKLGALNQVVASLRLPGAGAQYSSLGSVQQRLPASRPLLARTLPSCSPCNEEILTSPHGPILVARTGNPQGPAIVTFHDLGLNHLSNFQAFFSSPCMSGITSKFSIYHVNAPGQEQGAEDLSVTYPTMDQLSQTVEYVCHYYGIAVFTGLGVGLGANVLARLARRRPKLVEGLVLLNCSSSSSGWLEWAYHKVNLQQLKKSKTLPESVVEYLIWYHLGSLTGRGLDTLSLASIYRQHFTSQLSPSNLAGLIHSYVTRTDLGLARSLSTTGKTLKGGNRSLAMPVLNMVGDQSPHVEATVTLNGRLDPALTTWMKVGEAGMVLEEQPQKVAEALLLFLQGLGHSLTLAKCRSVTNTPKKLSIQPGDYMTPLVQLKVRNDPTDNLTV